MIVKAAKAFVCNYQRKFFASVIHGLHLQSTTREVSVMWMYISSKSTTTLQKKIKQMFKTRSGA